MSLFNELFDLENGYININNIQYLPNITFKEEFDNNELAFILNNLESIKIRDNARNLPILDAYYNNSEEGMKSVKYIQNDNELYGRQQAVGALSGQGMVREVRQTIFYNKYVDIDIDNCHPNIILWICNNLNIKTNYLSQYINNRDNIINELIELNPKLDREYFKKCFLSMNNGGTKAYKDVKNKNEFIESYNKEIKKISTNINKKLFKFKKLTKINKKKSTPEYDDYNIDGKTICNICLFVENQLLLIIINYLKSKNVSIHKSILCFDGIMMPKNEYDISYIESLNSLFKDKKINIKLSNKVMKPINLIDMGFDSNINYHDKYLERLKIKEETKDEKLRIKEENIIEAMNSKGIFDKNNPSKFRDHIELFSEPVSEELIIKFIVNNIAYIVNSGNSYYITKNFRKIVNKDFFNNEKSTYEMIYEMADIGAFIHSEILVFDDNLIPKVKLFKDFINKVITKISYDYLDFVPCSPMIKQDYNNKDIFNTFTGFMHDYDDNFIVDMDVVDIFLNHINKIVCNNDELCGQHFITFLADIIQNPNVLSEIRWILQSIEGAGKNILFYIFMEHVIGSKLCLIVDDIDKITGRFNGALSEKLLIVLDEACNLNGSTESHKMEQKMKSITTNPKLVVEKKGKEVITINNFARNVSLTNNDFASKRGRRQNFAKMNNEMIGNTEYFNNLATLLNDDMGKHIFHYLCRFEIKINIKQKIITKYELDIGLNSADPVKRYLIDSLNGSYNNDLFEDIDEDEELKIICGDLFKNFDMYCIENNIKNKKNKNYFSKIILDLLQKDKSDQFKINKINHRGYLTSIAEIKAKLCIDLKNNTLFD